MTDNSYGWSRDRAHDGTFLGHLGPDERHSLLSNSDRRALIGVLADRTTPIHLSELASEVALACAPTTVDADAHRRAFEIELHHHHLPRLEDAGIVEYDATTNRVDPVRNSTALSP
ncbi:DUF7344 domain-containing protein [Halorubellus salinus]|uniref:DUF7344 domain-containing protein n=1 Tax=Halorubellus salinus TaxID=755309 RepID=UPI001D081F51|nr:hypothetical protein [Halorubellus salinus]